MIRRHQTTITADLEFHEEFVFRNTDARYPFTDLVVNKVEVTRRSGDGDIGVNLHGRRMTQKGPGAMKMLGYVDWESNEKLADIVMDLTAYERRSRMGR